MPTYRTRPLVDPARLAALHESALLDAPVSESFDRLTRFATAALHTPVALVSLVDVDRQFFLSSVGLGEPWATARETPLSHSFCQHVVSSGQPLIVTDARQHPLVCDNLAIRDLGVIAYAGVPLVDPTGAVLGSFCAIDTVPRRWDDAEVAILRDLAAQAQTELALRAALRHGLDMTATLREREEQFRFLFTHNPHPMWVYDTETLAFLEANESAVAHYGYTRAEFLAMRITDIRSSEETARLMATIGASGNRRGASGPWQHRLKDGRVRTVAISSQALEWAGRPARLTVVQDITEREVLEEQLRHQAFHDALTDLPNRAFFMAHFAHLSSIQDDQDALAAVLFLDLDGFKLVNDSLGHTVGDRLLIDVTRRLRSAIRPGDLVARFGGDEFTLLLPGIADAEEAAQVAERLLHVLRMSYTIAGQEVVVTASIGIALGLPAREQAEELLRQADLALYQAKLSGKARWCRFEVAMDVRAQERLILEADLRRALERGEFAVVYQPQVELTSGRIVGTEALVRWHHPERGLVSPQHFIPIAEETGLIVPLGLWILETACRQAMAWAARTPDRPPLSISVNLSAREFEDTRLLLDVADILARTGLPPTSLQLEITEGVAMGDAAAAIVILQELKALGVRLGIDDFGTGYSSLAYLRRFPVDVLKVDKAFIDGLGHDPQGTTIVEAVIALGHALGLSVTAEGVETAAQAAHLRALGCETGQGYHFARPLSPDAVGRLLTQRLYPSPDDSASSSPSLLGAIGTDS